jgi:tetratricopeptide (TPR) repeat protein
VLKARIKTHDDHKETNTWGAYQCYGNPNFRLNLRGSQSGKSTGFYSRREYRDTLRSIASITDAQNARRNKWTREQLIKIEKELPRELRSDGELLSDFGEAWFALGNFEEAIKFYSRAIRTDDAKAQLKSVERLANLQSRYATQMWEMQRAQRARPAAGKRKSRADRAEWKQEIEAIREKIEEAGKVLDWLIQSGEGVGLIPGGNSERYALRGKVYKCQALIADSRAEREANLQKARELYEAGYLWAKARNEKSDSAADWKNFIFPAVNLVACGVLLPDTKRDELTAVIAECRQALDEGKVLENNFWTRIIRPELLLLEQLMTGDLAEHKDAILQGYDSAVGAGIKPSDAESVLWQMQFLIAMLESEGRSKSDVAAAKTIGEIRAALLQLVDSTSR